MSNSKQFLEFSIDAQKLSEELYTHLAPHLNSLKEEFSDLIKKRILDQRNTDTSDDENDFLSRKETMEFLKISGNCLREWTNSGSLNAYRLGKRTYYRKSEIVDKLLRSNSKRTDSK